MSETNKFYKLRVDSVFFPICMSLLVFVMVSLSFYLSRNTITFAYQGRLLIYISSVITAVILCGLWKPYFSNVKRAVIVKAIILFVCAILFLLSVIIYRKLPEKLGEIRGIFYSCNVLSWLALCLTMSIAAMLASIASLFTKKLRIALVYFVISIYCMGNYFLFAWLGYIMLHAVH